MFLNLTKITLQLIYLSSDILSNFFHSTPCTSPRSYCFIFYLNFCSCVLKNVFSLHYYYYNIINQHNSNPCIVRHNTITSYFPISIFRVAERNIYFYLFSFIYLNFYQQFFFYKYITIPCLSYAHAQSKKVILIKRSKRLYFTRLSLTLIRVALEEHLQLLFKTILHHDDLS